MGAQPVINSRVQVVKARSSRSWIPTPWTAWKVPKDSYGTVIGFTTKLKVRLDANKVVGETTFDTEDKNRCRVIIAPNAPLAPQNTDADAMLAKERMAARTALENELEQLFNERQRCKAVEDALSEPSQPTQEEH